MTESKLHIKTINNKVSTTKSPWMMNQCYFNCTNIMIIIRVLKSLSLLWNGQDLFLAGYWYVSSQQSWHLYLHPHTKFLTKNLIAQENFISSLW